MQTRYNHPVKLRLPPLHRRGIAWCRHGTTTPSSFACHPSTGGECHPVRLRLPPLHRRGMPPRQASPATPPQEGNATPSGFACHPSTGGECHPVRLRRRVQTRCDCSSVSILVISPPQEGNCLVQTRYNHPVKLRLPPLHRRGIAGYRRDAIAVVYLY